MAVIDGWMFGLAMAGGMLYVMSVAMPGWTEQPTGDSINSFYYVEYDGLWEICSKMDGVLKVNDKYEFMKAVDITASFGFFLLVGALVCVAVLPCISDHKKTIVRNFWGTLALLAAVMMVAALGTFAVGLGTTQFHSAFGMTAIAAILSFICALLAFCSRPGRSEVV